MRFSPPPGLYPSQGDSRYVNEDEHTKALHDALGLDHAALSNKGVVDPTSTDSARDKHLANNDLKTRPTFTEGDARYKRDIAPKAVTASYTATVDDDAILVDASGGARVISLPLVATVPGKEFYIAKSDSSTNTVTIDPSGSETIQLIGGSVVTTVATDVQGNAMRIQADSTKWVETT